MGERGGGPLPGGELELELLQALWRRRRATVRELFEEVGEPRGIVYTTVAKVLDRMLEKQLVAREREGRTYAYEPLAPRAATQRALARRLIDRLVGEDPRPAAAALLGAIEDVSPELLDELASEIAARRRRKRRGT